MTSLLQHHGGRSPDGRKVELIIYQIKKGPQWEKYCGPGSYNPSPESTTFTENVEEDRQKRSVLYRIYRRPVGLFGPWVIFRYNGVTHTPDLSIPIAVFKLPRDATRLTEEEADNYWKGR